MSESLRAALEKLDEAIDLLEEMAWQVTAAPPTTNIIQMQQATPVATTTAALDDVILSVRKMLAMTQDTDSVAAA